MMSAAESMKFGLIAAKCPNTVLVFNNTTSQDEIKTVISSGGGS
jgi:hypothetical protein